MGEVWSYTLNITIPLFFAGRKLRLPGMEIEATECGAFVKLGLYEVS